ncbi:MAG: hypothetical protein ACRD82_10050, partial [Blastocatellia bacterium]
ARLDNPRKHSAAGKLVQGILGDRNALSPLELSAGEFNRQAEHYYRNDLRCRHTSEAFAFLLDDLRQLESASSKFTNGFRKTLHSLCGGREPQKLVASLQSRVIADDVTEEELLLLINLMLVSIAHDTEVSELMQVERIEWQSHAENRYDQFALDAAPVY